MAKKCLNCGYERQPGDESEFTPSTECPKCHAIYEKVEKFVREKEKAKQLAAAPLTCTSMPNLEGRKPFLSRLLIDIILPKKGMILVIGIIIIVTALFFRYNEEYIQGHLYRYDKFTGSVQQKSGSDWISIPRFKNLQHVRDFIARRERNNHNEELNSRIEELTETIETMKMEQQHKELDRQNEQRIRDMNQEFREREREYHRNTQDLINRRR